MKINTLYLMICIFGSLVDTMAQNVFGGTRVIAHRGAWKNTGATENSLAALQQAIKLRCHGSEFDVHMSSDSVLFVHHDHIIQGVLIEKTPAAELAQLTLANGEYLPTLQAYLKVGTGQQHTRLILEIKSSQISKERTLALTQKCVELVRQQEVRAITDFISFDYDVCKKIKELDPLANVAYLNGEKAPGELAETDIGLDYHFSVFKKNELWVQEAHHKNLTTNTWTVNDREAMLWCIERKIDFITTNEPELLLELLEAK